MKAADIKRLERVVKKYEEIIALLNTTTDSIYNGDTEYTNQHQNTYQVVRDMLNDAIENKNHIAGKINLFKEL